jgi:membrane protease YdiL (CAAX protease family)
MMEISERDEHFLNFLSPALLITIGLLLLSIGAFSAILLNFFFPILIPDPIMASIQINLVGQIIGILVTLLFFIPFFGLKQAETRTPTIYRTIKVIGIACFTLALSMGLSLALWFLFTTLGIPIQHSYSDIILGPEHLSNVWNIVLFFATATIGAATFEELIYRRTLIPALEYRGMTPTAAVLASSLGFALIHVPNDLINGSTGYVVTHFITTFTIGLMLGFVYIFTRNVIYPIIIHGFVNAVAFTELILVSLDDFNLLLIYSAILLVLLIIGIIVGILALIWYFHDPPPAWVTTLRLKSRINIIPGLVGYLIIGFGLLVIEVAGELGITLALYPNILLVYTSLIGFYVAYFLLLLYIVAITHYKPTLEVKPDRQLFDSVDEITQEPRPE